MESEKVGPGHPPEEHKFQPGRSGNPRGRPPRSRNLATVIFDQLNEKILFGDRKITRFELMLRGQVDAAVAGDPKAVREIVKLWLSYHSDCPDGVDNQFEFRVVFKTIIMIEDLIRLQMAEDRKRRDKAAKSARLKKARAERARKKRAAAKAATEAANANNANFATTPATTSNSAKPL